MKKQIHLVLILLSFFTLSIQAQDSLKQITVYEVRTFGSVSTNKQTPFWMASNQYGLVPLKANNGYLKTGISHFQSIHPNVQWKAGLDAVASTSTYSNIYIQQLFSDISYKKLHLNLGSRQTGYEYNSSLIDYELSSGDMALSANARPIPEANIHIPHFTAIPFTKGWLHTKGNFAIGRSFENGYINHFVNDKQHFVQNPLWHHKSLFFKAKDSQNKFPVSFALGIRHIAQWGGESTNPNLQGKQSASFKDFVRIIFGKSGGSSSSTSDQKNALGAHYGTYDFQVGYDRDSWSLLVYYQHPFGDSSGMEFDNSLDGLKGVQINLHACKWLQKIVLEHMNTLNQSGPFHFIDYDHDKYSGFGGGGDDYYNNGEYTTGASYHNRSLGSPLLISPIYNKNGSLGFKHSRIQAWHLGIKGDIISNLSYRFLFSNMNSFGTPYAPTLKRLTSHSFVTDLNYQHTSWNFKTAIAADKGSLLGNHLGFSLCVTKTGVLFKK